MWIKWCFWTITVTPIGVAPIGINHYLNKIKNNSDTPITYHTHAEQMVYSDGSDVNTDFDTVKWHDVNFEQTFKKIYLTKKDDYINANRSMISLKQTNVCSDSNDSGTCGGKGYEWDINSRIHDWTNDFHDNLYLHLSKEAPNFGYSKQKLYLKQKKLLSSKQSYKSLTCPTKFGSMYEHASDISFNVGIHRNLTSGNWNVYGVNKAWLKETPHIVVFYNWVDRFLWTINAGDTPHNTNTSCPNEGYSPIRIDEGGINVGSYNITHLLQVKEPNYRKKSLSLSINNEYINFIKLWHDDLKNKKPSELTDLQKNEISKFDIQSNDDPWLVLNDIQDKLTFNIQYRVSDALKINEFENKQLNVNYQSLVNGIEIYLNKNENNKYLIQFTKLSTNEIIENDLYLQGCEVNEINHLNSQLTKNDNGFYELNAPTIKDIHFKKYDGSKINNVYPTSLTDLEVLRMFVTLIDSYGCVDDYDLLIPTMYQIKKDDINGQINVDIDADGIKLNKTFGGFKIIDTQSNELDASKLAYNLIAEELDNKKINEIFIANGYSESIMQNTEFKVNSFDNLKGVANIEIVNGLLGNHLYIIKNLQPYYIKIKDSIDKKYLSNISPSINIDELRNRYLDISTEFWSRNQESISFVIEQNVKEKTAIIKLSYYEELSHAYKKIDFTISLNKANNDYLFLSICIVVGLIILFAIIWLIYKKKIKKNRVNL